MRLDEYLVKNNYVKSRNLAKQYIEKGFVKVNDIVIIKPSFEINDESNPKIEITEIMKYVSRAGYKLAAAIDNFKLNLDNKIILDIGASTGGFSDCCLQNKAKKVYCVDVGSNQLDEKIKNNPKVINLENTNVKALNDQMINDDIDMVVSDLSFISSKYMFEALNNLHLSHHCELITLIKPQFELANEIVKKHNYCIKEQKYIDNAINKVKSYALENQWTIKGLIPSPIKGAKKENQEYLLWCIKNG